MAPVFAEIVFDPSLFIFGSMIIILLCLPLLPDKPMIQFVKELEITEIIEVNSDNEELNSEQEIR